MTWKPSDDGVVCSHKNKVVTDGENYDGEVYYECPDCGCGWRQKPETEADREAGDKFLAMDAEALFPLMDEHDLGIVKKAPLKLAEKVDARIKELNDRNI